MIHLTFLVRKNCQICVQTSAKKLQTLRSDYFFVTHSTQSTKVGSHLILPGFQLGEMKILHMNTCKWASPAKWNKAFVYQFCFFQMLIKCNVRTFVLHE